jgi:hypothetical protein
LKRNGLLAESTLEAVRTQGYFPPRRLLPSLLVYHPLQRRICPPFSSRLQ